MYKKRSESLPQYYGRSRRQGGYFQAMELLGKAYRWLILVRVLVLVTKPCPFVQLSLHTMVLWYYVVLWYLEVAGCWAGAPGFISIPEQKQELGAGTGNRRTRSNQTRLFSLLVRTRLPDLSSFFSFLPVLCLSLKHPELIAQHHHERSPDEAWPARLALLASTSRQPQERHIHIHPPGWHYPSAISHQPSAISPNLSCPFVNNLANPCHPVFAANPHKPIHAYQRTQAQSLATKTEQPSSR